LPFYSTSFSTALEATDGVVPLTDTIFFFLDFMRRIIFQETLCFGSWLCFSLQARNHL